MGNGLGCEFVERETAAFGSSAIISLRPLLGFTALHHRRGADVREVLQDGGGGTCVSRWIKGTIRGSNAEKCITRDSGVRFALLEDEVDALERDGKTSF
jgi:hypothetical protein